MFVPPTSKEPNVLAGFWPQNAPLCCSLHQTRPLLCWYAVCGYLLQWTGAECSRTVVRTGYYLLFIWLANNWWLLWKRGQPLLCCSCCISDLTDHVLSDASLEWIENIAFNLALTQTNIEHGCPLNLEIYPLRRLSFTNETNDKLLALVRMESFKRLTLNIHKWVSPGLYSSTKISTGPHL